MNIQLYCLVRKQSSARPHTQHWTSSIVILPTLNSRRLIACCSPAPVPSRQVPRARLLRDHNEQRERRTNERQRIDYVGRLTRLLSTYLHAASHLGITTPLRAFPYHAWKGHMVIPASITAKHLINQDKVFRRGPEAARIEDAVCEFAVITIYSPHEMHSRARRMPGFASRAKRCQCFWGAVSFPALVARLNVLWKVCASNVLT